MPGALQYGNVEERIARTVPQLNEPETFLRIEPFDGVNGLLTGSLSTFVDSGHATREKARENLTGERGRAALNLTCRSRSWR